MTAAEGANTKQACEGGERQRGEKSSWKELHRDSWVARASLGYSRVVASIAIEYARCVSVTGGIEGKGRYRQLGAGDKEER